jgi:phosphoribosylaminoimidazole (AIR) synthetase
MAYAELLQHTVTRYRKTEALGTLRAVGLSWAAVTGLKARITVSDEARTDEMGGTMTGGVYKGYMLAGADVQESDILAVTAGSGAGSWGYLKVHKVYPVAGRSTEHHVELRLTHTTEDPTA